MSRRRLLAIARKEALQLRRDPRSLALGFALPLILLVLFGYAISWDIKDIATAVLDQDRSARSRELLEAFRSSGYFRLVAEIESSAKIAGILERRGAQIVLVIPPDFGEKLGSGRPAELQAILDGSDANTATIALGYAQAVVRSHSAKIALQGRSATPPAVAQSRVWYNEELRSRDMIVPGLVAVVMMIVAAMLTSLTIAREWERGTMEQLAATPVTRAEVVLGKLIPYVVIGLVDVVTSSAAGVLLFDVPFRGDPLLLFVLSFFFLVGSLGLGIFISAVARSQLLATQMAMLTTFLPAFLLSGFMFAIQVMPRPLRLFTLLVPARYFLVVTRGIFLKGVGVDVLAGPALLMVLFGTAGLAVATRVFRKQLG
jgi:ABC-2 type transport system permease protein